MCDFHSVIIDRSGKIFHNTSNSHSGMARDFKLVNLADQPRQYFEAEWHGEGELPLNLVRPGYGYLSSQAEIPETVLRAAEKHYTKLATILRGEVSWEDTAPFNLPEYADVQNRPERLRQIAIAQAEREAELKRERERQAQEQAEREVRAVEAQELAEQILAITEPKTDSFFQDQLVVLVRAIADAHSLGMADVFEEEYSDAIQEAKEEGEEAGSEASWDSGYSAACDELYTQEYMDEQIEEAVEKAKEEAEEAEEAAALQGFIEGWQSCDKGEALADSVCFTADGLPSFLADKA